MAILHLEPARTPRRALSILAIGVAAMLLVFGWLRVDAPGSNPQRPVSASETGGSGIVTRPEPAGRAGPLAVDPPAPPAAFRADGSGLRQVPSSRFALLGVNLAADGPRAIVRDNGTGRVVSVGPGDRIETLTVARIGPASVTLTQGAYAERIGSMRDADPPAALPTRTTRGVDLPLPAPLPSPAGPYGNPDQGHHGY